MNMMFRDREDAARRLAEALAQYRGQHPLVLAIPRGAVPMAKIIADALDGEVDVVLVRKLRAPGNPEFAIGSVDETGWAYLGDYAGRAGGRQFGIHRSRKGSATQGDARTACQLYPDTPAARPGGAHRHRGGRWLGHRLHHDRRAARAARQVPEKTDLCRAGGTTGYAGQGGTLRR